MKLVVMIFRTPILQVGESGIWLLAICERAYSLRNSEVHC